MVAQQSGALFESECAYEFNQQDICTTRRPTFYCHYGLKRKGDFLIHLPDKQIHVECKQLGDVHSHFDKLSHCLLNVINGCYGKHFWLIYDYAKDISLSRKKKIFLLIDECKRIKDLMLGQGITFELIHFEDIKQHLDKLKGGV